MSRILLSAAAIVTIALSTATAQSAPPKPGPVLKKSRPPMGAVIIPASTPQRDSIKKANDAKRGARAKAPTKTKQKLDSSKRGQAKNDTTRRRGAPWAVR